MSTKRYYLSQSTINAKRIGARGLHVAAWEHSNETKVPSGHVIHHKDSNPFNNHPDNLECLTTIEHGKRHSGRRACNKEHLDRVRPMAAKWHSTPEGLEWHRKNGIRSMAVRPLIDGACIVCGSQFKTKYSYKRFCSHGCSEKHRLRSGRYKTTVKCIICGVVFVSNGSAHKNKIAKSCSRKCRAVIMVRSRAARA